MFQFQTPLIKRRRVRKMPLLLSIVAISILGYMLKNYFQKGNIPILDEIARLFGIFEYVNYLYIITPIFLLLLIIPAFQTLFKQKMIEAGTISFDEQVLKIKDGKDNYLIPESELEAIQFELGSVQKSKRRGACFMRIPTKNGELCCEFHLENQQEKEDLMGLAHFLQEEHQVRVDIIEK